MVRPKLTQQRLEYARHQPIYMAVIADLAYAGVIDKDKAEEVMGWDIPDYYPESIESIIYQKTHGVSAPVFSPAAGEVESGTSVTITCATAGADIYYTTDGSTPDATKTKYTAPVSISADTSFKAIAIKGDKSSSVTSAAYTIALEQVATPTATPAAGAVNLGTAVTLATTTAGATIYYTDDGTEPTAESGTEYTEEISITEPVTIKAIAVKEGMTDSEVLTAAYTILSVSEWRNQVADPEFLVAEAFNPSVIPGSPVPSTSRDTGKRIGVMCADDVDHIYVTSDGTTPSSENGEDWATEPTTTTYYAQGTVFKAVAVKEGMEDSNIVTYILAEEVGVIEITEI